MVFEELAVAAMVGGDEDGGGSALLAPLLQDEEELPEEGILLTNGILVGPIVISMAVLVRIAQADIEESGAFGLKVAEGNGCRDPVRSVILIAREGITRLAAGEEPLALLVDGDLISCDTVAPAEGHREAGGIVGDGTFQELPGSDGGHTVVPTVRGAAYLVEKGWCLGGGAAVGETVLLPAPGEEFQVTREGEGRRSCLWRRALVRCPEDGPPVNEAGVEVG
ncbi:MAG: hypothetical protein RMJ98_16150 [Myxococcales bacterium]|nr:hypothetical protein [Polyangiaceae bacterium]MDW8250829.1 hypothetical protein [Myxococcales bacterium]